MLVFGVYACFLLFSVVAILGPLLYAQSAPKLDAFWE